MEKEDLVIANSRAEIEAAKDVLYKHGYYVDNLWNIKDVEHQLSNLIESDGIEREMSSDDMYNILDSVLTSDWLMNEINCILYDELIIAKSGSTLKEIKDNNE